MLRSIRLVEFEATHIMAALPSWHPCARMHGHNFQIAVQLTFEDDEVREIDDAVFAVSIATAQLEQLLSHAHLNELMAQDGDRRNASEQWLAGFAHGYIAERLPGGQSDQLTVFVRHGNLLVPRRHPEAEPGMPVEFPSLSGAVG